MSGETTLTIIGNLTADPELRFTPPPGRPWPTSPWRARRGGSTPKPASGRTRPPCSCGAASGAKPRRTSPKASPRAPGSIVSGRLHQRSYDTKEGEKRTVVELAAEEIGPSLTYATTTVAKVARSNGEHTAADAGTTGGGANPWAGNPAAADEPPF